MSDPPDLPPSEAADDVTVGAWLDLDEPPSQPGGADAIPLAAERRPSLWARLRQLLRGGS